jgi:hypothetical protein
MATTLHHDVTDHATRVEDDSRSIVRAGRRRLARAA